MTVHVTLKGIRDAIAVAPFWVRTILLLAFLVPFALALPVALFGFFRFGAIAGGVFGFTGVIVSNWSRDSDYWRLPREKRLQILDVQRTGEPSGDQQVDGIALRRLDYAVARASRSDHIVLPIVLALILAMPIVAAWRSSAWWLLASASSLMLFILKGKPITGDSLARLERLEKRIAQA